MGSFWQRRTVTAHGRTKEVGEFALQVQCSWRIRRGDQVVVGCRDLYYPPEESDSPMDDFRLGRSGGQQARHTYCGAFRNETRQFLVRKVEVCEVGGFTIIFDEEYALDFFPDDSLSDEH